MCETHGRELWCSAAPSVLSLNGDLINWTESWNGGRWGEGSFPDEGREVCQDFTKTRVDGNRAVNFHQGEYKFTLTLLFFLL